MARYNDNAPVGNTCPMIDNVISIIERPIWNMDDEDEEALSKDFKEAVGIMEQIRSANMSLREWGNDRDKDADEYEKELDELRSEIDDLKRQLSDANDAINNLEQEVSNLEDKIEN